MHCINLGRLLPLLMVSKKQINVIELDSKSGRRKISIKAFVYENALEFNGNEQLYMMHTFVVGDSIVIGCQMYQTRKNRVD